MSAGNHPSPHLPDHWNSVTHYFQDEGCMVSIKRASNSMIEDRLDPAALRAVKKRIQESSPERSGGTFFLEFDTDEPIFKAMKKRGFYARQEALLSKSQVYQKFMAEDLPRTLREGLDLILVEDGQGNAKLRPVPEQITNEALEKAHAAVLKKKPLPLSSFFKDLTCDRHPKEDL